MTSVLKRPSQINPRIAFFIVLDNTDGYTLNALFSSSPVMQTTTFNAAFTATPATFTGGNLLKDLGRQITVYDPTTPGSAHIALFRQVMQVVGPAGNEGVSSNIAYICTWEDGSGAYTVAPVARTG